MKKFEELSEKDQEIILFMVIAGTLKNFLSYHKDDIDDIPSGILFDLQLLVNNYHPRAKNYLFTKELRERIKARLVKSLKIHATKIVNESTYSETACFMKFDTVKWYRTIAEKPTSDYISPEWFKNPTPA
jgi:hypothetical protein